MERVTDKRKARDKETDSEASDTSLNKNPTKRPRVDFPSSSSSPMEKSPSPASAQRSPMKSASVADSLNAATPGPTDENERNSNGELVASSTTNSNSNGGGSEAAAGIPKFDLPSPFTTQELEKIGKNSETNEDSDSDNGSTKFLSGIIQSEENKRKRQGKGKGKNNGNSKDVRKNGTPSPVSNAKRNVMQQNNNKSPGKASHKPLLTSSPLSDLSSSSVPPNFNCEIEVKMKGTHPVTREVILEETIIMTDYHRLNGFMNLHGKMLAPPSSQSQISSSGSGYLGDVSSMESSAGYIQGSSRINSNRLTVSSLGSTIPRNSIVSIATEASESPEELMKRPGRPISKARKRSDGPIMSSTKYDDSTRSSNASLLDRMNVSSNPISNGDEFSVSSSTISAKGSGTSQSPRAKPDSPQKKLKQTPSKTLDKDEGIGSTPGTSTGRKSSVKGTPGSTVNTSTSSEGGKSAQRKRRVGSASNFPITTIPIPALNTPPPARSVAKIEGTTAKPVSRFEQEMNNEPVVETELEKASTLWSTILPEELVFARWRDKSYYSGMVKNKGLNDTWIIDFDDGMEDVASESHIVPIRILGVGVKGVYSPDEKYEAKSAEVIGQKFGLDPDTNRQAVKYAIRITGESKPIWCSRRQLSIKEVDAKKLRAEYQPPVAVKAGDVSLDNIVSGPRRRTRGGTESETSATDNRLLAGAFDASSADDNLASTSTTPKSKPGPKPKKKTPASEAKKKKTLNVSTPLTKDASTSSPVKEVAEKKESPVRNKNSVIEFGRKKSKKTLFQGIQFFLTASGGGDPGISGTPIIPADPYDKDEVREQIESCGGQIIDTVGQENAEDVFLISDSYARTVKYIYCLAASIPCISHSWIKQCLDQNEILEWRIFMLPAGWSLEHQDLIQHHVRKPLKDCKVFVTSESDQLYNYWKPVLTAAQAVLLKPPRKKGTIIPSGTEVVVTDNHSDSTEDLLKEAKALNLPVVKPEWLVQTIITGEKAHMYGHDKYKILFNETEESEEPTGEGESVDETSDKFSEVLDHMQSPD